MDDFNVRTLETAKDEFCSRLLNILTPAMMEGIQSIFNEAVSLCRQNGEMEKYLMTFQNLLSSIAKWNKTIIDKETDRIVKSTKCNCLHEHITCIHVLMLKMLTTVRVGQSQKKIDLNIPELGPFIHNAYIHAARKIYTRVYLFELGLPALKVQKMRHEIEKVVNQSILDAVRDSIPMERILRAYMDETEDIVVEEVKEQMVDVPVEQPIERMYDGDTAAAGSGSGSGAGSSSVSGGGSGGGSSLQFNDVDAAMTTSGVVEPINAPKTIERLEEISAVRMAERKAEEAAEAAAEEAEGNGWGGARPKEIGEEISLDALGFEEAESERPVEASVSDEVVDLGDIEILD